MANTVHDTNRGYWTPLSLSCHYGSLGCLSLWVAGAILTALVVYCSTEDIPRSGPYGIAPGTFLQYTLGQR